MLVVTITEKGDTPICTHELSHSKSESWASLGAITIDEMNLMSIWELWTFPCFFSEPSTEPFMFLREIFLGSDRGQPPRAAREILLGYIIYL